MLANSRKIGELGTVIAMHWFVSNGYNVSIPLADTQSYDLIADKAGTLSRVSVKYTAQKPGNKSYLVGLRTTGQNSKITKDKLFDKNSCELLFVVCEDGTKYLFPSSSIDNKNSLTLSNKYAKYKIMQD